MKRAAWGLFGVAGIALAIIAILAVVPMVWIWAINDLSLKYFAAMFISWLAAIFLASIMVAVASDRIAKGVAGKTKQIIDTTDSGPT